MSNLGEAIKSGGTSPNINTKWKGSKRRKYAGDKPKGQSSFPEIERIRALIGILINGILLDLRKNKATT